MLNLTTQEKRVIVFLVSVALLGVGINFLVKKNAQAKELFSLKDKLYRIDLNSADKDTLMSISGIGEKLALRIIERRRLNNGFQTSEELKSIKGMTEARFEKIKDTLIVR